MDKKGIAFVLGVDDAEDVIDHIYHARCCIDKNNVLEATVYLDAIIDVLYSCRVDLALTSLKTKIEEQAQTLLEEAKGLLKDRQQHDK